MEDDSLPSPEYPTDLDSSFTSLSTTTTSTSTAFTASSARSSLALSCLSFNDRTLLSNKLDPAFAPHFPDRALSFNDRLHAPHHRPHRRLDPHWSSIKTASALSPDNRLHLRHLQLLRLLGQGDLGRVFLCRLRDDDTSSLFALKVVDRDALSSKKLSHAETEARILSVLDHPFLPTLYAHIHASHYSCLLIDYCPRGDLNTLLSRQPRRRFPVGSVRFYASEVLVALEYLHSVGVVYRDLKPENILIREDGHVMLSDFDLCFTSEVTPRIDLRECEEVGGGGAGCFGPGGGYKYSQSLGRVTEEFVAEPTGAYSRSCVGTHEYLAPELVGGEGHGSGVDWWAFGVLMYELLYGRTPFKGVNKEATLWSIASARGVEFPEGVGAGMAELRDLIERLLVKDPSRRLGSLRGAADIKRHPFFEGVKWPLIRSYKPPEMGCGSGGVVAKKGSGRKWWWRRGISYVLKKSKGSFKSLKHTSSSNSYVSITKSVD